MYDVYVRVLYPTTAEKPHTIWLIPSKMSGRRVISGTLFLAVLLLSILPGFKALKRGTTSHSARHENRELTMRMRRMMRLRMTMSKSGLLEHPAWEKYVLNVLCFIRGF
jgi:hypothetical protein